MAKKPKPASAKKPAKPVEKAAPAAKRAPPAKPVPPAKTAPPAKPAPAPKPAPASKPAPPVKPTMVPKIPVADAKSSKANDLKRRILERKAMKPIAFSLDEVREIAKRNESRVARPADVAIAKPAKEAVRAEPPPAGPIAVPGLVAEPVPIAVPGSIAEPASVPTASSITPPDSVTPSDAVPAPIPVPPPSPPPPIPLRPPGPNHVKAASLADILGFNPSRPQPVPTEEGDSPDVPEKFRRYFKLLIELRSHVLDSLGHHSEETLKRSAKEDAGDLSGYGQHMADAGTDTFDRDFALSLVSSEQDALSEVEAAIKRVRDGTYGICELTGKPISKDRLLVVPFTRYSAEAQKELEKTKHRSIQRAGIFADTTTEESGKIVEEEPEE